MTPRDLPDDTCNGGFGLPADELDFAIDPDAFADEPLSDAELDALWAEEVERNARDAAERAAAEAEERAPERQASAPPADAA